WYGVRRLRLSCVGSPLCFCYVYRVSHLIRLLGHSARGRACLTVEQRVKSIAQCRAYCWFTKELRTCREECPDGMHIEFEVVMVGGQPVDQVAEERLAVPGSEPA